MSEYDFSTGKIMLTQSYTADYSDFTDPNLVTNKGYLDFIKNIQISKGDSSLLAAVASIVGVTGSSAYLDYEQKLDTIKEIADKIAENFDDASNLLNDLTNEIGRGKTSESGVSAYLLYETTRAIAGETDVSLTNLTERTRAIMAENVVAAFLSTEVSRATGIQNGLSNGISAEKFRSLTVQSTLSSSLTAEYQTFSTSIANEMSTSSTNDTDNTNKLLNEQSLRIAGDTSFQLGLSSETNSRIVALQNELSAMTTKDTSLALVETNFELATNTTLTGITYDNQRYIFNSSINETGHYLNLGDKWRIYGSAKSTIFQILSGTTWKNVVTFNKTGL